MIETPGQKKAPSEHTFAAVHKRKILVKISHIGTSVSTPLKAKYDVSEVYDSDNICEAIAHYDPLLIVFELCPENLLDDLYLCRDLKDRVDTFHIPLILLSKHFTTDSYLAGIKIGADAYLKDPVNWDILSALIENLICSRERLLLRQRYHIDVHKQTSVPLSEEVVFIDRINKFIIENLDNPEFGVEKLCDSLSMSRSLVYKKLKYLKGRSVIEYMREKRIEAAAKLLTQGRYKVYEVAYMVGFSDQKYFRKLFVRQFGIPPSKYLSHISPG